MRMSGVSDGVALNKGVVARSTRPMLGLQEGPRKWYDIKNQTEDSTDVYLYDEISYFGITAQDFVNEISKIDTELINLHMNTPGGIVSDGIAIYNCLLSHEAEVHVLVDGWAASIGSVIAMAGDKITMGVGSQMMVHEGHGVCIGTAQDMEDFSKILNAGSENIAGFYARRAGGSVEDWREVMKAETWYNANEAVAAGLADEVAKVEDNSEIPKNNAAWDLSMYNFKGRENSPPPPMMSRTSPLRAEASTSSERSFAEMLGIVHTNKSDDPFVRALMMEG